MPESGADNRIVEFLQTHGYHPRSSAHGDALCGFVLDDLVVTCESFRRGAEAGQIVYDLNHNVGAGGRMSWNVDLVVGPPSEQAKRAVLKQGSISRGTPSEIWVAIDAKSVMTEHGKARRNRQRDLNSLHDVLHRRDSRTIVAGLVVVNAAAEFRSPLRASVTEHRNILRLVEETVQMYADIPRRTDVAGSGLDAMGIIVISHTNVEGDSTALITDPPAPGIHSPVHYRSFLGDICTAFESRFRSK